MRFTIHPFIRLSPLMLTGAVVAGCAETAKNPVSPSPAITNTAGIASSGGVLGHSAVSGEAVPNLRGTWAFRERVWVLQPSELNAIIGAPAVDKPMTQVVCNAEGALDLEQQGASFWGTATQSVICSVDGVQFVPPAFAFNPEFVVRNGRIQGHSVYFETGHIIGPQEQNCTNRGSVSIGGGSAEAMRAVGNCPVPFHPGEHHSSWTIWRP